MIALSELTILSNLMGSGLYRVAGDRVELISQLDFPFRNSHVLGGNRWVVAIIGKENPYPPVFLLKGVSDRCQIFRAKVNADGSTTRLSNIVLPSHFLNQTLAICGDVIYLGGHSAKNLGKRGPENSGELAGFMDLSVEEPVWHPLPLPINMQAGKSIDDILIYDNKLVLVDNIMYPKYLFEYNITDPLNPIAIKTVNLPNNGTYEHIHRGSINNNWMALLSSGVGRSGTTEYVSVFSLPGYEQCFSLSLESLNRGIGWFGNSFSTLEEELEKARSTVILHDFAVSGDMLLVACGFHGLAAFPLREQLTAYQERRINCMKQSAEPFSRSARALGGWYSLGQICSDDQHKLKILRLDDVRSIVPLADGQVAVGGFGETLTPHLVYEVISLQQHTKSWAQ